MNERDLRYIIAIAEERSLKKASQILDKNPSSLSRCIKRVEKELEITLFHHTPGGLIPTLEGEIYLQTARQILALYAKLK